MSDPILGVITGSDVAEAADAFEVWWREQHPGEEPYCPYLAALFEALGRWREGKP